jgi:group I intron endonuclease
MGYIYKITNQLSKKCYIGETKKSNPYLRWNEHKRKIEQGIGCPALQDAVKKYGIENFIFEVLIICFDEDRYKLEIEYIKKYNSMAPNGYNLTKGGEGGGFHGKKHSQETIERIRMTSKQKYIEHPELKQQMSERQKIVMNNEDVRNKIKEGMLASEKWKSLKQNMKLGNRKKLSEETKNKIRESVKYYFNEQTSDDKNIKILKHREIMANLSGVKIAQYDSENILLQTFISIKEAGRQTNISYKSISSVINGRTKTAGGFIWEKI